jgi:hypothetical protein
MSLKQAASAIATATATHPLSEVLRPLLIGNKFARKKTQELNPAQVDIVSESLCGMNNRNRSHIIILTSLR